MRALLFSLLILSLFLPALSAAETIDLNIVIATLESPFKGSADPKANPEKTRIYAFQAEFFQESRIAAIDRAQHGQGEVSFKFLPGHDTDRPVTKFRWLYRQPTEQEIISDGRTLWVYQPENSQVIETAISPANGQQEQNPVTFLGGLGHLSRDFKINWATPEVDEDGNYQLELLPRRDSQLIQTLQLVVDRKAVQAFMQKGVTDSLFPILATRVTDPNGNRTSIEFRDIRVNPDLPDTLFTFVRPEGVEVVRPGPLQKPQ